ncbi:MAG TPA: anaerobic ribonucleoside-triphosphate reductase [Synergistaceae bacterium]|nr:anaerobic ribonucleoside-triphosphate reductase [Synergistaceae bacterium]HPJ25793.1 anaerobic ribonucleoside-triphosphate reductase [Synergistaceae bacterium]HPQ38207.1 anaerobic ribonucleoside-triphosphate reductase [Synergistaceae bacterium]
MEEKKKRTPCEIFSRVVGFLTPLSQWNVGKREEFRQRKTFDKVLREEKKTTEKSEQPRT